MLSSPSACAILRWSFHQWLHPLPQQQWRVNTRRVLTCFSSHSPHHTTLSWCRGRNPHWNQIHFKLGTSHIQKSISDINSDTLEDVTCCLATGGSGSNSGLSGASEGGSAVISLEKSRQIHSTNSQRSILHLTKLGWCSSPSTGRQNLTNLWADSQNDTALIHFDTCLTQLCPGSY